MKKKIVEKFSKLDIVLTDTQVEQFITYYEMLVEKNKVMNLTAITEFDEVLEKHFVDSVAIVKAKDMEKVEKVLDIGTGAGFPGIPLKIVFPHLDLTLLDSLNKRIKFLEEVVAAIKLENVHTLHGRAEDYAKKPEHREVYDLCVSRAVANLATLSEYCLPYVSLNGKFVSYKSGDIDDEVKKSKKAVRILGGDIKKIVKFQLPDSDISRSFVVIEKEKNTPKKYPRKAGTPTKEPIV